LRVGSQAIAGVTQKFAAIAAEDATTSARNRSRSIMVVVPFPEIFSW
jgi:hypothetical protein